MKKLYFLLLINLMAFPAFSQYYPPAIEWQKSFGTSGEDIFKSVIPTLDGGYIAAGRTNGNNLDVTDNHGGLDVFVVKYSSSGAIQWKKTYGGTKDENVNKIIQNTDGSYIIVGSASSTDGDLSTNQGSLDAWIFKINSSGVIEWQKSYGSTGADAFTSIQLTPNGGYIAVGGCGANDGDVVGSGFKGGGGDVWLVKVSSLGQIEWKKSYGSSKGDEATDIQNTLDGGYIIVGNTAGDDGDVNGHHSGNFNNLDVWIVKVTNVGVIQWQKSLGGGTSETPTTSAANDLAFAIEQTDDGGYVAVGYTSSVDGDVTNYRGGIRDGWIVKLSGNGNLLWQKTIGGSSDDHLWDIAKHPDGGFVICGYTFSGDGDLVGQPMRASVDGWIIKTDNLGTIQWQRMLRTSGVDWAISIALTAGDGFIVGGLASNNDLDATGNQPTNGSFADAWIIKLSAQVLPVTLLNAVANYKDNEVRIQWQTTREVSFEGFVIERSNDGILFSKSAFVPSKNNLINITDYSYTDKELPANASALYYRLKLLDNDGSYTFSKIMQITIPHKTKEVRFYPNPYHKGKLHTTVPVNGLTIYSLSGSLVYKNLCSSCTSFTIPSLSSGNYLIKLGNDDNTQTQVLSIQP